jgi:uncharacterized protein YqeY
MSLKDQISQQIMSAMKAQDKIRLNALRYVKKLLIENDTSGKPQPEADIVISYAKKIKESIELYPSDSQQRLDLEMEYKVLEEFLPKQLSESEVVALIDQIKQSQASANVGSIMKELTPMIKGAFDGKRASELVKASLV